MNTGTPDHWFLRLGGILRNTVSTRLWLLELRPCSTFCTRCVYTLVNGVVFEFINRKTRQQFMKPKLKAARIGSTPIPHPDRLSASISSFGGITSSEHLRVRRRYAHRAAFGHKLGAFHSSTLGRHLYAGRLSETTKAWRTWDPEAANRRLRTTLKGSVRSPQLALSSQC